MRRLQAGALATVVATLLAAWSVDTSAAPKPSSDVQDRVRQSEISEEASIFVARMPGRSKPARRLDTAGMTAHLVSVDDPDTELVFDASGPFEAPPGNYLGWLQGEGLMSPFARFGALRGLTIFPVVPAGRVTLSRWPAEAEGQLALHLLHAGNYRENGFLRWELMVRRPRGEVGEGVVMPEGRALAGIWDSRSQRYLALSRPFVVPASGTVEAPISAPGRGTDVLLRVGWGSTTGGPSDDDFRLWAAVDGEKREPSAIVTAAFRTFAVWYGLTGEQGQVLGETSRSYVSEPLELVPGTVQWLTTTLAAKASLEVELRPSTARLLEGSRLELRRTPSGEVLDERRLKAAARRQYFDGLVPGTFEVALQTELGEHRRSAELGDGERGVLVLEPQVVNLFGMVTRADRGLADATLTFSNSDGETRETVSDETGAYEVALLAPVRMASIAPAADELPPFVELFFPPLDESSERNFSLPSTVVRVRVLNEETGAGVASANISVRNTFMAQDAGDAVADPQERVVAQEVTANEQGLALLPPLRRGSAEITVTARGYEAMEVPRRVAIERDDQESELEIVLKPAGETVSLRLALASGSPATGASVFVLEPGRGGRALFRAQTDAEGSAAVPRRTRGILLATHPEAATLMVEWRPPDESAVRLELPLVSPVPFQVRVRDARGGPVARAELAVRIGGHHLSGLALAAATGGAARTDEQGYWATRALPPGPVEVVAWALPSRGVAAAGMLDSQAVTVPFPWPQIVDLTVAE